MTLRALHWSPLPVFHESALVTESTKDTSVDRLSSVVCSATRDLSSVLHCLLPYYLQKPHRKMDSNSDVESDISFHSSSSSSSTDRDGQWPNRSLNPSLPELDPSDYENVEKFILLKQDQVRPSLFFPLRECSCDLCCSLHQMRKNREIPPGTVRLGHIPHAFAEEPLRKFFSQFGKIRRLNVFWPKKVCGQLCPAKC